jgi:acyl-coenzyme A synthetase/AMP-(fatty) acid ligase
MLQTRAALLQRSLDDTLFWRPDEAVSAITGSVFLRAAARVASALPEAEFYLNLCRTPCGAAIAVAAAMLRGSPCILVTDHSEASITALLQRFPGAHPIMESADERCTRFPHRTMADPAVADAGGAAPHNPELSLDQVAIIGVTSGSTGRPTMHAKSWGVLERRSRAAAQVFGLGSDGTGLQRPVVASVSPTHMYGMETTVLLPLHAATITWCAASVFPGDAAANLARAALIAVPRRIAPAPVFITTPLHLGALVEAETPMPQLHAVISATAPLDAVLAGRAEARWQAPVLEIFGATEVGSIASRRTTQGEAWTLYPGISLEMGEGVTEVVVEGASRTALSDILEPLPDGRFRLLARGSDIIKRGGRRASLAGLTRQLAGLEGVQDAAFLMPDPPRRGRGATLRPVAFAVAPGQDPARLLAALGERIEPAFLPRSIILLERLPRNAMGKLPRDALVELWQAHGGAP